MPTQSRPSFLLLALPALILCMSGTVADAQSGAAPSTPALNDPVFEVTQEKSELRIVEKFAKVLKLDKRITTVSGFDQSVINVSKVERSPNMIRVHAEKPGVTSLVITDEDNRNFTLEVFVIGDVRHLQAYLKRLFPNSSIEAVAIGNNVILRGWVSQPEHITEIREVAAQFYENVIDQMKVGGVQQVQLKVRVMEMQRAKIRRLGFNFLFSNNDGAVASTPGQLTALETLGSTAAAVTGVAEPTVAFSLLNDDELFQGFLEALKEESLLKILAEPELVTTNGRPAHMLAGGEFPILVPQSLGTTTIEWREFGVRLQMVPIILGRGRVRLELEPEVSERDFSNAVQVNGFTVPGITSRRVNTQVEMRFGETFMIAGLLSRRTTAETSKIPLLGELPWVGAAFRRVRYDEGETELVIMVTPELVSPMKAGQVPPGGPGQFTDAPLDRELYIDGVLEVPRYGPRCPNCGPDGVPFNGYSAGSHLEGVQPIVSPSRVIRSGPANSDGTPLPTPPMPPPAGTRSPRSPSENNTRRNTNGWNTGRQDNRTSRRSGTRRSHSTTTIGSRSGFFSRFRQPVVSGRSGSQASGTPSRKARPSESQTGSLRNLFSNRRDQNARRYPNATRNNGQRANPGLIRPRNNRVLPPAGTKTPPADY